MQLKMKNICIALVIILCVNIGCKPAKELIAVDKQSIMLSAIKGEKSRIDTVSVTTENLAVPLNIEIIGAHSKYFNMVSDISEKLLKKDTFSMLIEFRPDLDFTGVATAEMIMKTANGYQTNVSLSGLSTKGLAGKNEAPLSLVVATLELGIDVGWDELANHVRADLQGEELPQSLFQKSGKEDVEMIPVARYSPDFKLPFGYYTIKDSVPNLHEIGVLALASVYPEHQTLFPKISSGSTRFDPSVQTFGFYTKSPSHLAYSEDVWNEKFFAKNAAHACRIYPVKNKDGKMMPNQYLVCFEEAFNGDYQDYVFLVKNIKIAK
jgi:hypothetical protein